MACSPRNLAPAAALVNSSRAPASWGPKALNCLAPPGLRTSSLAVAAQAAAPPLRAAAQRRLGPLHSAPGFPEAQSRRPHRGSFTCAAPSPASSARSSLLARQNADTEHRSLAPLRSGSDRSDKPRLACERPGPRAHTLRPAPPGAGWRFPEAPGGGRCLLARSPVAQVQLRLPLRSSLSCWARAVEAGIVAAGLTVSLGLSSSWFLGDRGCLEAGADRAL